MDPSAASQLDSFERKIEYKRLLEIGTLAVKNNENTPIVDAIEQSYSLIEQSNGLLRLGTIGKPVYQSSELVLDSQVAIQYIRTAHTRTNMSIQCPLMRTGSQDGARFDGHDSEPSRKRGVQRRRVRRWPGRWPQVRFQISASIE